MEDPLTEAGALDLLLVPRQTYCDTLAVVGGLAPSPISRRDPAASHALVERLLGFWRILPSLPGSLVEDTLKEILQPNDYVRLRNGWIAVSAFARAQFVGALPVIEAFERS